MKHMAPPAFGLSISLPGARQVGAIVQLRFRVRNQ
jgi:hypothetical protein